MVFRKKGNYLPFSKFELNNYMTLRCLLWFFSPAWALVRVRILSEENSTEKLLNSFVKEFTILLTISKLKCGRSRLTAISLMPRIAP